MVININNMAQVWILQSSDYIERYVTSTKESYMKFGTIMAAAYVSFGLSSFNPLNMFMPETILAVIFYMLFHAVSILCTSFRWQGCNYQYKENFDVSSEGNSRRRNSPYIFFR